MAGDLFGRTASGSYVLCLKRNPVTLLEMRDTAVATPCNGRTSDKQQERINEISIHISNTFCGSR